jgi:hypothetical protein
MIDNDEIFEPTSEADAETAADTLGRYADERDKILDNARRILSADIPENEIENCIECIREALGNAYYDIERDLREKVREYESTETELHHKLERMGL